MQKEVIEQVARFFELRFPKKKISFEMRCGYFWEWVDRFNTGRPEDYMDIDSLEVYKKIKDNVC